MYIANPFKADSENNSEEKSNTPFFIKIFMTHPPIEERIKKLKEMSL
jgi:Zn-dependent protease with chaperone function